MYSLRMKALFTVALAMLVPVAVVLGEEKRQKKVGRALLTFYWIVDENSSKYDGKRETEMRDARGRVIAMTHPAFRRDVAMEGTGWLRDGRTVRFHKRVKGEHRFQIIKSRYGITSSGCPADPYKTVAVDPRFVKLGSKIYVPELKGTILPDGSKHDGIFVAQDRGAFRGAHIDVFVGLSPRATRPFIRHGNRSRSYVTVYLEGSRVRRCRR